MSTAVDLWRRIRNKAIASKLITGEAINVMEIGDRTADPHVFHLHRFIEDAEFVVIDGAREDWIRTVGRTADGQIWAATDERFADHPTVRCLWPR